MAEASNELEGPDLEKGYKIGELADGTMLLGHAFAEPVLVAKRGAELFAIGATCTHYGGPLVKGLMVGDTVRCPWHHACFDLRTGEAVRAPAFDSLKCWTVEQREGKIFVRSKKQVAKPASGKATSARPERIVIIGGGAAGFAAVEMLRREQYRGGIVMLSNDSAPPVDRPNLSKDYLAGNAPEDWVPLRPEGFYADNSIDLRLGTNVVGIETRTREVVLAGSGKVAYDRL